MNINFNNSKLMYEFKKLAKKFNLRLLILFGSYAKGNYKKESDIDIAFLSEKEFTSLKYIKLHEELMNIFNYEKIDLIDLKKSKKLHVKKNIYLTGVLLYEKLEGDFSTQRWNAWVDFQNFKRYYELQSKINEQKIKELML